MFIEHVLGAGHSVVKCFRCISAFNSTCIGLLFVVLPGNMICSHLLTFSAIFLPQNHEILDLSAKFQDKHYWSYFNLLPSCLSPKHFLTPTPPPVLSIWIPYLDVLFIFLIFKNGPRNVSFSAVTPVLKSLCEPRTLFPPKRDS